MNLGGKRAPQLVRLVAIGMAAFIHPIAWPGWTIEALVRRWKPGWEFNSFSATPYFITLTLLSSLALLSRNSLVGFVGAYIMTAMEVLCLWLSVAIAVGRRGSVRNLLSEFGRRGPSLDGQKVLLTPTGLYAGTIAYAFTVYYFAFMSSLLHSADPGAYQGVAEGLSVRQLWQFLYFSVITISTLGYGDILPTSMTAQALTMAEVGLGLFFVVFLFGGFVSYHVAQLSVFDD